MNIELTKDEYICDECNGEGFIIFTNISKYKKEVKTCEKCRGNGKVDWIENLTWKQHIKNKNIINIRYFKPEIPKMNDIFWDIETDIQQIYDGNGWIPLDDFLVKQ